MKKKGSKTRRRISNRKMMNRKFTRKTRKTRKRTRTRKKRVRTKRVRTQRGGEILNLKVGDKVLYTERGYFDTKLATVVETNIGPSGQKYTYATAYYGITIDEDADPDGVHRVFHPYNELTGAYPGRQPEPEPEPVKWPTGAELGAMPDLDVDEF